jgi:hypothetical protein
LYKTRFVFQLSLADAGKVASYVTSVLATSGHVPSDVRVQADDDNKTLFCTVSYLTHTSPESNAIIGDWKLLSPRTQVERLHVMAPDKFETAISAGVNGRALRRDLAREVRNLCTLGVGSGGILDYIAECESVIAEARGIVESLRAQV